MNPINMTINELKSYLKKVKITDSLIKKLKNDSRKGVKKLARKYEKRKSKITKIQQKWQLMNEKQNQLEKEGYSLIAGVDEAGRGPLAGPVVAGAVVLDSDEKILGLDDSKKLNLEKRQSLFKKIKSKAVATGVGIIDNNKIDEINIYNAALLAMKEAINDLDLIPDYLLLDGNTKITELEIMQEPVVGGDAKINNIAAASILAKVTRDNIIEKYHKEYPEYDFQNNKGYATSKHIQALKDNGPTPIHRYSYAIVKKYAENLSSYTQTNMFQNK